MEGNCKHIENKNSNFHFRKICTKPPFFFKGTEIEKVTEYKYLGIFLSKSGSYLNCKKHIAEQANNAMFSLLRKIRVLPIDMQIDLVNKLIKPILLYGCEIWAFGNLDIIERVQLKFLKLNTVIYGIW